MHTVYTYTWQRFSKWKVLSRWQFQRRTYWWVNGWMWALWGAEIVKGPRCNYGKLESWENSALANWRHLWMFISIYYANLYSKSTGNRYRRKIGAWGCGDLFPEKIASHLQLNIISNATDGRPLVGRHRYFQCFEENWQFLGQSIEEFEAKNLNEKLQNSRSTVVNEIKAQALNSRLLYQLVIENDEDFQCLLLHTEIRWLSKGNGFKR